MLMSVSSVTDLSRQLASGLYRNMSEFVRTCAIYLGIAVLVAAVMVTSMPGLRAQAFQMHGALLFALAPDAFGPPQSASLGGPIAPLVNAISLDLIPGDVLPAVPPSISVQRAAARLVPNAPAVLAAPAPAPDSAPPAASGASQALAKATEPSANVRGQSPAEVMSRLSVTPGQQEALVQYLTRKYLIATDAARMFVETAYVIADEVKIDPLLLLSVVAVESNFNPYAGGQTGGATGLMQVMFALHRDKFSKFGRAESMAFNPVANMRVGAFILSDCIRRRGSVLQGLLCYCGAASPSSDRGYTNKVMSERRRLALAGSISLKE